MLAIRLSIAASTGSAAFAQMQAEGDAVAFGLALLALGAAAFQAWRAGAETRGLRARARALVKEAEARGGGVTVNIGGTGERAGAIDVNPQVPGTERVGVPNLVQAQGERIGELFPAGSVDEVVGNRLPHNVLDCNRVAAGAARAMRPGGWLSVGFYTPGPSAQQLGDALRQAGFREVNVIGDAVVQATR